MEDQEKGAGILGDSNNNTTNGNNNNGPIDDQKSSSSKNNMKDRKVSWAKLRRVDSLNLEAGRLVFSKPNHHSVVDNWKLTLSLAFQCIGVVYGDIGTSPLYVYASTFPDGIGEKQDLYGVLSLIIYTLILSPMIKYVFIVLWANDNGNGGTFALYSKICRHANVALIPNQQPEDAQLSNYSLDVPSTQLIRAYKIKNKLENSKYAKLILFFLTILGVSMIMGDGTLTPCISVLSAVSGIKGLGQDAIVGITVAILIMIFYVQRYGTDKVGYSFGPIITLWFMMIGGIGLYNLFKHDVSVLRAFNPKYIIEYFKRNGQKGWISLGGVVLCITGTEAMFADLGHFSVPAVQISFSAVVFPALLACYSGQAAYLIKFPEHVGDTFYSSVPDPVYWPMFVVAIAASIIASQAMISAVFSIISQAMNLGSFPGVTVIHTSKKHEGQVYIPELTFVLMVACILITISFRTTEKIGNAYGIAVVSVFCITTCMTTLIMLMVWKTRILWICLFFFVFFSIEAFYLSAILYKFIQGGYLPFAFSIVLMTIMATWHYVHKQRYTFELRNKVSTDFVKDLATNPSINRVPGIGLLYSQLVQGIPPILPHLISNIQSLHSVMVIVSIKSIPISNVAMEERFLFRQVEPKEYRMFRCVVRYGYNDAIEEPNEFERLLVENLKDFIRNEHFIREAVGVTEQITQPLVVPQASRVSSGSIHSEELLQQQQQQQHNASSRVSSGSIRSLGGGDNGSSRVISGQLIQGAGGVGAEDEIRFLDKAMEKGVVYLIGEAEVRAEKNSSFFKKFVINYYYSFIRKNFSRGEKVMAVPRSRLLRVGMTYEI